MPAFLPAKTPAFPLAEAQSLPLEEISKILQTQIPALSSAETSGYLSHFILDFLTLGPEKGPTQL